ncbi:MAG TPA: hypothetical protein VL181_10045 [Holophagaceae bacterium]|nr:hypothetical protein [Holophagaceae bacterium]
MPPFRRLLLGLLLGAPLLAAPPQVPDMQWRMIGPFRGGRTRAACGVASEPNLFYIGQVDGGVWRSDDYGRSWTPIFDGQPSQSVGAIAVAPSDPRILYVGSGEGLHRPDLSIGDGIYKSSDAGKTWRHLGLRDGQQIPALAVDPHDPNRLFAAVLGHPYGPNAERGIYRSTDGGESWKQVLYKDENTGASDVELDPAHPNVVYAAMWESRLGPWEDGNQYGGTHGGLFKSTDGGDTWHPLTQGLPADLVQIQIALAPSDSNRLYATVSTPREGGYASGQGLGVYRSDDAGEHWRKITDDPRPAMKIGGGDLPVPKVDPENPDVLYSASIVAMKSTDGGRTWAGLRGAPGGDDYQNLWINPRDPRIILLVSDQGAVVTVNGGRSWSSWYNQPTAQLYHVATTNTFPYRICAAQQESGSVDISSRGNDGSITFRDWHPAGAIEYGYLAPDPLHPEIIYGAGRTEVSKYDTRTGQVQNVTPLPVEDGQHRADRTEPILFSPVDPHLLFYAANVLFKTMDGGATWQALSPDLSREHAGQPASLQPLPAPEAAKRRGAIYAVAPSFQTADTIWAGTDDGLIWITRDQGKAWKDVTPPGLTPWSKVTQISASHFDDATAYASVSRFRVDDLHPYLYRTHDGGATWQSISAGLPDGAPVNTVREDPVRKGLLFAGTETAVWMSLDDGDHWRSLQLNLPHTSMRDLCIQGDDLILATHGRSIWILDGISVLRQLDAASVSTAAILFKPGEAWRIRRSTNTDTPLPADEPAGQNPPDGAVIDYALPGSVSGPVTLEILDAAGRLVRRYASDEVPEPTPEAMAQQLIPGYWLRMPRALPSGPGMHRWVWDLRYAPPSATSYDYPISAVPHDTPRVPQGPLALPGRYTVRLTADGHASTAPLTVRMDPRVPASREDLAALFALESRLAESLSRSSDASLQAHSLREQIETQSKGAPAALAAALSGLDGALAALVAGTPASPGLDALAGDASALYTQVGQADARPTAAQQQAAAHAAEGVDAVLRTWEQVKASALPALNRQLREAHREELSLQRQPTDMPAGGDED